MRRVVLALLFSLAAAANAQYRVFLELPIVDLPDNADAVPTMQQSLAVSAAFYETSHAAIQSAFGERKRWGRAAVALFDFVTAAEIIPPGGDTWLHEEFHRAVMSNRGIDSHNDVYDFELGPGSVAVSHVRDEDLIRLKRDHPADQVRLGAAGIEGEQLLIQRLQKQQFFGRTDAWHLATYWLVKANSWAYLFSGADRDFDDEVDDANGEDGPDVGRRDFTGHDFNGWVYDLFRPHEPYTARGVHPSGVGVDRYRKAAHLTEEERDYLDRQGVLALINFADPHLYGVDGFPLHVGGRRVEMNVTAAHFLTSFGNAIDANLFLRSGDRNLFVVVHRYANGERSFPGVEAQLVDLPVRVRGRDVTISPRLALWTQPENQLFRDRDARAGGLAALRVDFARRGRFGTFVELETKTGGWVAGNVHLDANTSLRLGGTVRFALR